MRERKKTGCRELSKEQIAEIRRSLIKEDDSEEQSLGASRLSTALYL